MGPCQPPSRNGQHHCRAGDDGRPAFVSRGRGDQRRHDEQRDYDQARRRGEYAGQEQPQDRYSHGGMLGRRPRPRFHSGTRRPQLHGFPLHFTGFSARSGHAPALAPGGTPCTHASARAVRLPGVRQHRQGGQGVVDIDAELNAAPWMPSVTRTGDMTMLLQIAAGDIRQLTDKTACSYARAESCRPRELIIPQGSLLAAGTFKDHIDCMSRIIRGQETGIRWQHSVVTHRLATCLGR